MRILLSVLLVLCMSSASCSKDKNELLASWELGKDKFKQIAVMAIAANKEVGVTDIYQDGISLEGSIKIPGTELPKKFGIQSNTLQKLIDFSKKNHIGIGIGDGYVCYFASGGNLGSDVFIINSFVGG